MSERLLVLVRHGQSEWNLKNLFTGWRDPDLTEQGVAEAKAAGQRLKAIGPDFRPRLHFRSVSRRKNDATDARRTRAAEFANQPGRGPE